MTGVEDASTSEPTNVASLPASEIDARIGDPSLKSPEDAQKENELTEAQLSQIEEEKQTPLVGDRVPFEVVVMEYDPTESAEFYHKAKDLLATYSDVRIIRRDGNCFYRAVLVAQVELMLSDPAECTR
ncbi:unnamed protein product [Cylicostephanus goldi]|uniref:ubiquitinyl hydrolase 1 n=1 Tax=Cylicostephanus goldi TaxID=71465 RepID=A0A3P6TEA1_CYLGO|nr:unnamed protein product [Cylicostephanus goldi]